MEQFEKQGGISFLIIFYSTRNELFYLTYQDMKSFWDRAKEGGRKSFRYEELDQNFRIQPHGGILVPYLDTIQKDLDGRD
jgi:recombination protein U